MHDTPGTAALHPIYPVGSCLGYFQNLHLWDVVKKIDYPQDVIGIVRAHGFMEHFDIRGSDAYKRARDVDAIALWFPIDATFPAEYHGGERVLVNTNAISATEFSETYALVKPLVRGLENQLSRRVIAVGFQTKYEDKVFTRWLEVPKTDEARWHGKSSR